MRLRMRSIDEPRAGGVALKKQVLSSFFEGRCRQGAGDFLYAFTFRITGWQWSAAELSVRVDAVVGLSRCAADSRPA